MVTKEELNRINELARKQKAEGLNEAEKKEQQKLRKKYVESVKSSLKAQLDRIEIVEDDQS